MSFIALVLSAKIAVTGVFAALPFLLLSPARISSTTGFDVSATPLFRLYGVAVTALLVGYASGFWVIASGQFPWGVVAMGIVSNGVGAITLVTTGFWRQAMPMTFFIAGIAILLIVAALINERALVPLW